MRTITTIGLDIAKSVFQVHGVDAVGQVVIRRQLKRRYVLAFFQKLPSCLIGMEACASAHHWSRELQALGHTVRLMPPAYVKPYVKRHKNDATDAEAICEAVTRPNMRFVATKTPEQQSCLTPHRAICHVAAEPCAPLASSREGALYRSQDVGKTWQRFDKVTPPRHADVGRPASRRRQAGLCRGTLWRGVWHSGRWRKLA